MSTKREALWDNLKFFLILSVVTGHFILFLLKDSVFCRSLYVYIYSYHMPLFIFIAGYFHRNQNLFPKLYFYVITALLLRFFLFAEQRLFLKSGILNLGIESDIPWFMLALAAFTVLAYFVKDINPKLVFSISIIIGFFVGYDKSVNDFLVLSRILVFFPFYYAGVIAGQNDAFKSLLYVRNNKKRIFSVLCLVIFFILCMLYKDRIFFLKPYFNGRYPYASIWGSNYLNFYSGMIRLMSYAISFLMGYALIILTPPKKIPIVSSVGTKTLQIYFWHIFFVLILHRNEFIQLAFKNNITLIFVLAVFLTLFLSTPLFSFPLRTIREGCLNYKKGT